MRRTARASAHISGAEGAEVKVRGVFVPDGRKADKKEVTGSLAGGVWTFEAKDFEAERSFDFEIKSITRVVGGRTEGFVLGGEPRAGLTVPPPRLTVKFDGYKIVMTVTGMKAKGGEVFGMTKAHLQNTKRCRFLKDEGQYKISLNDKGQCDVSANRPPPPEQFDFDRLVLAGEVYRALPSSQSKITKSKTNPGTIDLCLVS